MKTVALVPIKLNNERTPGKNTKKFADGSPLISFIQAALLKCEEIDEVYVYCSQEKIKDYLLEGVRFLKRNECFDSQSVNVNEMFYAFSQDVPADIYVLAHATAPFQKAETIDEGVKKVKTGEYDSAIAVKKMQEFIWRDGKAANYDPKKIPRTQDLQPLYVETTGLYIYTNEVITNYRSRIGNHPYMLEVSPVEAVDINNPIDFEIADAINSGIIHGPDRDEIKETAALHSDYTHEINRKHTWFRGIEVLDSTLRDGGYCNNWEFGQQNIKRITEGLADSGIDIIECGFISNNGISNPNTSIYRTVEEASLVIPENRRNVLYVAMMNYGEYEPDDLSEYKEGMIDGIRLAFHKKDIQGAMSAGRKIKEKGYRLFMQPMVSLSYEDEEFLALIKMCNEVKPYAFYIVDSFGVMKERDLMRLFYMVEHNLSSDIAIGFHSHNNMQLAYSNAQGLVDIRTKHRLIIDCCIYGMGRGAGNLNTELFVGYLNDNVGAEYKLNPLLNIIDEILDDFHRHNYWGYSLPNYLSAAYNTHPNYAGYLNDKHTLNVGEMNDIFEMMDDDKRAYYDRKYMEGLYLRYLSRGQAQEGRRAELIENIKGKTILLIAPGSSSVSERAKIENFAKDVITVSINYDYPYVETDYIFLSNLRRFKELDKSKRNKCIVTSNISADLIYLQIDYKELLNNHEMVQDNAGLMAVKFFMECGVKNIYIAGMDGYSHDMNNDYENSSIAFISRKAVLDEINIGISEVLKEYAKKIDIHFLTEQKFVKI